MAVRAETQIDLNRVDNGTNGQDGYSPTATVTKVGDTATITITDLNGTTTETVSDGADGDDGVSVVSIRAQYYLSDSSSALSGGSWSYTPQEFETGKYYWTREEITYSNNTTDYSTAIYNQGLTLANEEALNAHEAALLAAEDARSAYNSASQALSQLSVVENVVGVLDLISNNGEYELTQDTEAQADKWYFVRSGSGTEADPYIYEVVIPAEGSDPSVLGYYQLVGIDQAIQNYVSSHLTLSGNSLFLQNGDTRVELSTTDGMILYNEAGAKVAQYGSDTIIGDINNFGIKIGESPDSTQQNPVYELGFYQDGNRVAYINNNSLYITQTVVLRQMELGDNVAGIWAWCIHEVDGQNNLYLKWLGTEG